VNGIGDVVTRPDLLDRCLLLSLPAIPAPRRRDERELLRDFAVLRPRVLGAQLDAVSAALRNLASVRLARAPRLADFARWVTAAEPALGWPAGTFLHEYDTNRADAHDVALDASAIAPPLRALAAEVDRWEGTAADLLAALAERVAEPLLRSREWPTSPRALAGALRRLAPNLRAVGTTVEFDRDPSAGRRRLIRIRQAGETTVQTVQTRASGSDGSDDGIPPSMGEEVDL
jgi:hypothetical protein